MTEQTLHALTWLGRDKPYLDTVAVTVCGRVSLGCYGGRRDAGATKNEDGALIWCAPDGSWEVVAILDAHASSASAAVVLAAIAALATTIASHLTQPVAAAFRAVEREFLDLFTSAAFRETCRSIEGETACLICVRREQFFWWLNIGDCVAYLFHPQLAALGQYALNQRQFFEWIGRVNTFNLPVPCYTSGVRELRAGRNVILLTTDGLLECGARPFERPEDLHRAVIPPQDARDDIAAQVQGILERVHQERGRDSATVVAWAYESPHPAAVPSR